jgi:hypothetical protein
VVLFTACHDSPLPFPLLAAANTSWSTCIADYVVYPMRRELRRVGVGRFYAVDVSESATSAAVQAVLGGEEEEEEELWVGEQHCRRVKAAQDSVRLQVGEAQDQQQPPAGPIYIWITLCLKSALETEQPRMLQSLLASLLLPCQADLHVHVTVNDVAAAIVRYVCCLTRS